MEQIERMRYKHRIRVLQSHEETTKQNVVRVFKILVLNFKEVLKDT